MSIAAERSEITAPTTYQEWLHCFSLMKNGSGPGNEIYEAVIAGSFAGTDRTKSALQQQIVDTVNAILDKRAKRFVKELNDSIAFNELAQVELLFRRLRKEIHRALFFRDLFFLSKGFRTELADSVMKQMNDFWNDTVDFLYEQSLEFSNSELEDVLFLIKRIKLFQ
jgi:hypothetical protein